MDNQLKTRIIRIALIVGVVVVVGAGGYVGWLFISAAVQKSADSSLTPDKTPKSPTAQATQNAIDDATSKIAAGDKAGAINTIDSAISGASTNNEKAELYGQKSLIYANSNDTANAAIDGAKAAELDPADSRFDYVASLYEAQGDKTKAIEYYKKALEAFDKDRAALGEQTQIGREYYVDKIKALGGTAS